MFTDNKKVRSYWYALTEKGWKYYISAKAIVEDNITNYKINSANALENNISNEISGFESEKIDRTNCPSNMDKLSMSVGQNVQSDRTNCPSNMDKLSMPIGQNVQSVQIYLKNNKNIYNKKNIKKEHNFVITNSMLQECVITNILSHAGENFYLSSSFLNFFKIYSSNLLISDKFINTAFDKFQEEKSERYPVNFVEVIKSVSNFKKNYYSSFFYEDDENLKSLTNKKFNYGEYEVLMSQDKRKIDKMQNLISLTDEELLSFALEYPYTFNLRISQAVKKITKEKIKDFSSVEIIRAENEKIDMLEEQWIKEETLKKQKGKTI